MPPSKLATIETMSRIVLFAALAILSGCGPSATGLEDLEQLAESLQAAKGIKLYEGLPHQHLESQLFEDELESSQIITFDEFPFYATPQKLTMEDGTAFTALFCKADSFVPLDQTAAKACGGFHPDYCLTWRVESNTYLALLCFGCREVKSSGNGLEFHADIHESAHDAFVLALQPYHKSRPGRRP